MRRFLLVLITIAALPTTALADKALEAEALAAINRVFDALMTGDPDQVAPLLAPEFQIVRSYGAAYDREQYLAQSIPKFETKPAFKDLVATRNGDIVVTRMRLEVEELLDGKKAVSDSPQLIVFRITPDAWQVVASGNFAPIED
ncbi:nuclear transport factor 2 family protein [Bauldia sp.]|uniref:nuclear transport factor 2 family protein n=1 Tax=Bauldia sp. TaxID=2575872 RepID=UPI003BAC4967